jgi:hypothetical protein
MNNNKKIIVGETPGSDFRTKLKAKIKETILKKIKEISTSSAAGGGNGDGSAGPVKTPYAFGKGKDPTTGLGGYKQIGKSETGTITEKESKKKEDGATSSSHYKPISKPASVKGAEADIADTDKRLQALDAAEKGLAVAQKLISKFKKTRKVVKNYNSGDKKSDDKKD